MSGAGMIKVRAAQTAFVGREVGEGARYGDSAVPCIIKPSGDK